MNPYATAFSQMMSQLSGAPNPNSSNASMHVNQQSSDSSSAYHVYIPGAAAPGQISYSPSQYPTMAPSPYFPYANYPVYPSTHIYPPQHSQYAIPQVSPVYTHPTVYPSVVPGVHMPNTFPFSQQQQQYNRKQGKNNERQNSVHQQKKQPYSNSHGFTPSSSSTLPITPGVVTASDVTESTSFGFDIKTAAPATPSKTFYCEPCDKEFPNQATYNSHCSTHETCTVPGCSFTASKRVVQAHFHSTHGQYSGQGYKEIDVEGQSFRVLLGTSPEEVAQWRAERRQKFPSGNRKEVVANETTNSSPNKDASNNQKGNNPELTGGKSKKSLAAQRREEWKLKKQQQRSERQHYKQLRDARQIGSDDNSQGDNPSSNECSASRNFIQIRSQTSQAVQVISSKESEDVTIVRLPGDKTKDREEIAPGQRNPKRARFDPSLSQPKRERKTNGSVLRKPDISGNLFAKLLMNEIRAEENLILQSIRFLRELYDPRCQSAQITLSDIMPEPEAAISTESKQELIQQLTSMDIDTLIAEAENAPEEADIEDELIDDDEDDIEDPVELEDGELPDDVGDVDEGDE
jgi:hypothetical protein